MNDSILVTIKKLIGVSPDFTDFDIDLITHINSVMLILRQLGIGPEEGYVIEGYDERWGDYISDISKLAAVKSYIAAKVRMAFDPPTGGALDALKSLIAEFEWRLNVAVDPVRW